MCVCVGGCVDAPCKEKMAYMDHLYKCFKEKYGIEL